MSSIFYTNVAPNAINTIDFNGCNTSFKGKEL